MIRKLLFSLTIFLFSIANSLTAFQPADYVSAEAMVYIESAPFSQVIRNIDKFYRSLKIPQGPDKMTMLDQLGKKTEAEIGINLLNEQSLTKAGFDTQLRMGVSIGYSQDEATGRRSENVTIYLPAKDEDTLYATLVRVFREQGKKVGKRPNARVAEMKEIESGRIFHYKKHSDVFIAKGDNFVTITNKEANARASLKKPEQAIASTDYYTSLKQSYSTKFAPRDQVLMYVINPSAVKEITRASMRSLSYTLGMPMSQNSILMKELEENLRSIGGFMSLTNIDFSFSVDYVYKQGYLQDTTKVLPKILKANGGQLSTDFYSKSPIVYMYLRFALAKYIELLKEADPNIARELENSNREFVQNTGMTLDKDLLGGLTGVFSFVIGDIPAEVDLANLSRWEAYLAVGYKPEFRKNYSKLLQKIKEKAIKNKNVSMKKSRYRRGELWTIKVKGGFTGPRKKADRRRRPNQRETKKKKKAKTESIFVYLGEKEAIITTSRKYLAKALIKGGDSLLTRLFKLNSSQIKDTNSVFYLNIATIVRYLNQSSLSAVLAGYLPVFQNINDFNIQSLTKQDVMSTEFNLTLKP